MHLLKNAMSTISSEILRTQSEGGLVAWLGAISFEDRCIASAETLTGQGLHVDNAIVLTYATKVIQAREDREKRLANKLSLGRSFFEKHQLREVKPYVLQEFEAVLYSEFMQSNVGLIIFDVTCLTKLHTMALAAFLARNTIPFNWIVTYTLPETYGDSNDSTGTSEWDDVLIAPFADTAQLLFENFSRGILVLGHEPSRLLVGLNEIEPASGTILIGDTTHRPELRHVCESVNRKILARLSKLRAGHWEEKVVGTYDFDQIARIVRSEIVQASIQNAPVILFPFGPKPVVFEIAYIMAREYPQSSWFVYPVPRAYDVNYSDGIGQTHWLRQEH